MLDDDFNFLGWWKRMQQFILFYQGWCEVSWLSDFCCFFSNNF